METLLEPSIGRHGNIVLPVTKNKPHLTCVVYIVTGKLHKELIDLVINVLGGSTNTHCQCICIG